MRIWSRGVSLYVIHGFTIMLLMMSFIMNRGPKIAQWGRHQADEQSIFIYLFKYFITYITIYLITLLFHYIFYC